MDPKNNVKKFFPHPCDHRDILAMSAVIVAPVTLNIAKCTNVIAVMPSGQ